MCVFTKEKLINYSNESGRSGHVVVRFTTTFVTGSYKNVVRSNPAHCEVYSIEYYAIKCVCDLSQVGGFLRFPPSIHDILHQ